MSLICHLFICLCIPYAELYINQIYFYLFLVLQDILNENHLECQIIQILMDDPLALFLSRKYGLYKHICLLFVSHAYHRCILS